MYELVPLLDFLCEEEGWYASSSLLSARQANRYHTRPPHTMLGSSSALSGIDVSDECLLQTSGIGHISEIHLCGAGCDVRDGFYQFSNYRLADDFALQFKVRAGDFGVTAVYDPGTDGLKSVEPQRSGVASC